jgi:hypothetical protein
MRRSIMFILAVAVTLIVGCAHQAVTKTTPLSPLVHPTTAIHAATNTITVALTWINILGVVALGISVGLLFTPISTISKIAIPVSGAVVGVSLAGIITLPFAPYLLYAAVAVAASFSVYELILYFKGSPSLLTTAVANVETDVKKL